MNRIAESARIARSIDNEEANLLAQVVDRGSNVLNAQGRARTRTAARTEPSPKHVVPAAERYSFFQCLNGVAPAPAGGIEKNVFQLLTLGCMVAVMTTFNGVRHSGVDFFFSSHWMYPVVLCIALCLRLAVVNRVVDHVAKRYVRPRFKGFSRNVAMALLNTALMAPIMGTFVTLLLNGPENMAANLAEALLVSAPFSLVVSLFLVTPFVKFLYHNVVVGGRGTALANDLSRHVTGWAGLLTS